MRVPRVLWRYLFVDTSIHTLIGLAFFASTLAFGALLQKLDILISTGVSGTVLLQLTGFLVPMYMTHALPTAFLFGVLISLGRMAADSEIVALRSLGFSLAQMMPPVLVVGAFVTGLGLLTTCVLEPMSHYRMQALLRSVVTATNLIEPGMVRSLGSRQTLYVTSVTADPKCPLEGVLLADFSDREQPFYVAARCGAAGGQNLEEDAFDRAGLDLELWDGSIHFEEGREQSYRRIAFNHAKTELDLSPLLVQTKRLRHYTMNELDEPAVLERFEAREIEIERQRRLALPFVVLLFGLIGLPLGSRATRSGNAWGMLMAISVASGYWCAFAAARRAVDAGWALPAVGLWLPNAALLLIGIVMLVRGRRWQS